MNMASADDRYTLTAIFLHWLIAFAIIFMLGLGLYMTGLKPGSVQQFEYYQLHKSIGITILALSLVRVFWRVTHLAPPMPDTLKPWEAFSASAIHYIFYGLIIVMPLSGWMMISTSTLGLPTRLYGLVTLPPLSFIAGMPGKKAAGEAFGEAHEVMAWIMIALLALHVGAALRHHFILKDNVLKRMLP